MRHNKNKDRHLVTHFDPKSPVSEAFRTLRTNIQFASVDKDMETLMVTSTGPAEGKSTVVANLAVTMAQSGRSTLMVDADLRKPTVHYTFRVLNHQGLTNVITRQNELEEVVTSSANISNLDILPSGPIPPNPAELLGSVAMSYFIEKAKSTYDVVLFDTPPVLAVTDSQILASQMDGTLLVVSSGKTNKEMAVKAKDLLENVQAHLLGCVLNNREMKANSQYFYYYGTS